MEDPMPGGPERPGAAPPDEDAYGGDEQLQQLSAPPYQNWWYNDNAYHVQTTVTPREYRRVRMPQVLNGPSPFVEMPVPDHLTISPALARRLRQTYDSSDLPRVVDFDTLFGTARVAEDVDAEERRKGVHVTMDIQRAASKDIGYDPNDRSDDPSVESGESFEKQDVGPDRDAGEGSDGANSVNLLEEVGAHLDYLKDRLRRLTEERDSGSYRYRRRLANLDGYRATSAGLAGSRGRSRRPRISGTPVRGNGECRAPNYSPHPTVDPIALLNRQALEAIDARDYTSLYEASISRVIPPDQKPHLAHVQPQVGGGMAMVKRNLGPYRPAGHLRDRSIPISIQRKCLGQGHVGTAVAFGEDPALVRSKDPLSFACQGRPLDRDMAKAAGRWTAEGRPEMMRRVEPELISPRSRVGISDRVAERLSQSYPGGRDAFRRPQAKDARFVSPVPRYSMSGIPGMPDVRYEDRQAKDDQRAVSGAPGIAGGKAYELNLEPTHDGDQDPDILKTTTQILAQLRADEAHLVTLMRDTEGDRTRPPAPGWFNLTGDEFTRENAQAVSYNSAGKAGRSVISGYREELGIIEPDTTMPSRSSTAGKQVLVGQFDCLEGLEAAKDAMVGEDSLFFDTTEKLDQGSEALQTLRTIAASETPEVELPVAPYDEMHSAEETRTSKSVDVGL